MREPSDARGATSRWVDVAFGLLFVGISAAILYSSTSEVGLGAWAAALIIGGLGLDALLSAARNRRSLVSRIGPLP